MNKEQNLKLGIETIIPYDLEKHSPFHCAWYHREYSEIGEKMFRKGLYDPEIRGDSLYFFAEDCKSE